MTSIAGTSLLSGMIVQQKYGASGLSVNKSNQSQSRTTVMSSGDTVQISSEAWELFRAQTTGNTTETQLYNGNNVYRISEEEDASSGDITALGNGTSVRDQVSQLKTEISSLESEIASLEEKAETDELAAAVLRSKLAQLQTMQARLMGLLAKSYQIG